MPDKRTIEKARKDKRAGKASTTQAGEFVREEVHRIRRGGHGARSPQQVVAIGLSKARRAGVDLPPPAKGRAKERTRKAAQYAYEAGQGRRRPHHRPRVARAVSKALKRAPRSAASPTAMSRQAASAASRRTPAARSAAAQKAVRTRMKTKSASRRRAPAAGRGTTRTEVRSRPARTGKQNPVMIRKLPAGGYRLYSRNADPKTKKRRNLGTFATRKEAEKHERAVQYFKRAKAG